MKSVELSVVILLAPLLRHWCCWQHGRLLLGKLGWYCLVLRCVSVILIDSLFLGFMLLSSLLLSLSKDLLLSSMLNVVALSILASSLSE